jgi:hypothetical protein
MNASRTTITEVEPLAERWVRLTFGDGAVHEVDLAGLLRAGGELAAIRDDREMFDAVAVHQEFGTIVWLWSVQREEIRAAIGRDPEAVVDG